MNEPALPDDFERRLIIATQAGLPLVPRPYDLLAEQLGVSAGLVKARLAAMLETSLGVSGPSMSSPAMDSAGNVYFLASARINRWKPRALPLE